MELITRGEESTSEVINSILAQTFNSFEIVVGNFSDNPEISGWLDSYGIKHVDDSYGTKFLKARYLANTLSKGDYSLVLDSTRTLAPDALELINNYIGNNDMAAIKEGSKGSGFWVRQAEIYKRISEDSQNIKTFVDRKVSYILPRVFRRTILKESLESLKSELGVGLFEKIGYGEHHLIFEESLKRSRRVIYVNEKPLIFHYEDNNLAKILRKYYGYGKGQKSLSLVENYSASNIISHKRATSLNYLKGEALCTPIILARSLPFLAGLFFGKTEVP